jgi:hypothetical protein
MGNALAALDAQFAALHRRSVDLIRSIPDTLIFQKPRRIEQSMAMFSVGEYCIRSAAIVEQACGGITTRLWDDPFEWTLPEQLATGSRILEYLAEVEIKRKDAFKFLTSDEDLPKRIPAPEELRTILEVLLEALVRAGHFQGRAFAIAQVISDNKIPRF